MNDLLHQVEGLFLGSIPTMVLFLLLIPCYTVLVHRPLTRTLAERRERTAGAVERAQAAIAVAEGKAQEYEAKLRGARLEAQRSREKQVAGWNAAREAAVGQARDAASARVRAARRALEAEAEASRASLEPAIDALAAEIVQKVVPAAGRGQGRDLGQEQGSNQEARS